MPKPTFFNLPEEKRKKIIAISLVEFARYDFKRASLSRIVETLDIAKGSMYQYFHNKQDLYFYLMELASAEKLSHIAAKVDVVGGEDDDFFSLYGRVLLEGTIYDFTHPTQALLLLNGINEPDSRELGRISDKLIDSSRDFLETYVRRGIERGEIRKDLDPLLIVLTVNQASLGLKEYLEGKFGFSVIKHLGETAAALPMEREILEKEIQNVVDLLHRGIAARGKD